MQHFSDEPLVQIDYNNKLPFKLLNTVTYTSNKIDGKVVRITVRKNFRWDGLTILPIFWTLLRISSTSKEGVCGSLIHDVMCVRKEKYTNKQASIILRDLLIEYGVDWFRANIMMIAVWVFQELPINKGWKK